MQENPRLSWGDAIMRAESDFAEKIISELKAFIDTGAGYCEELGREFPIFKGWAPPDHPYPEAWTKGRCVIFQKEGGKTADGSTEIVICGKCDCDKSRHKAGFFQGEGHKLGGSGAKSSKDGLDEMD